MDKLFKKIKDGGKKELKKDAKKDLKKDSNMDKTQDEEEDEPAAIIQVEVDQKVEELPKQVKVPVKRIDETDIEFEMEKKNENKKEIRLSWVPQQGGVIKTFDMEKDKEHFVAIGEAYTPEVKGRNSNFLPMQPSGTTTDDSKSRFTSSKTSGGLAAMEKTPQQILEEQMQGAIAMNRAPTLTQEEREAKMRREEESKNVVVGFNDGPKNPRVFTKSKAGEPKTLPIQKSPQQLMEEELMSKQVTTFQSTVITKEDREGREFERKKLEEEAAKLIHFGVDSKPRTFTSNKTGVLKELEKTPQQLQQEQIEKKLQESNLISRPLTKEEVELQKQRTIQRAEQKRVEQETKPVSTPTATGQQSKGPSKFKNSSKANNEQPKFLDLKNTS